MAHDESRAFVLPTLIFGMVEVRRVQRELELLNEQLQQATLRQNADGGALRVSRLLDALANENHCDLQKGTQRALLAAFLQDVVATAPNVHISFAADPSSSFAAKIVSWLRASVHPLVLLQIGLQPNIAAGCVVRTTNHVFDLSLRNRFVAQQDLLIEALRDESGAST